MAVVARSGALGNSESRFERLRSFTESKLASISPEKRFDRVRSFAEKIVAIQNLPVPAVPREESPPPRKSSLLAFRVSKCARVQCNYGFEKLQHTEAQVIERQHARAQKLIAENLRQSDPTCRRRRRRRFRIKSIKRSMILSPFMACLRWLSAPLARLARIASLAGSKMDRAYSKKSARVSADYSPLLSS